MDCPILVWMLSYNRPITSMEYDWCYRIVRECVPHIQVPYAPQSHEAIRQLVALMLPLLMMRHRRIPRAKWKDCSDAQGRRYIEQEPDNAMNPTYSLRTMIGYHLAAEDRLAGMVMTQGRQREVVNLGIGLQRLPMGMPEISVTAWAESQCHKLTPLEISFISPNEQPDVILRRLCALLALKQAYVRAIGQHDFDYSRLEFNLPGETARMGGYPLQGWEFRLWTSNLAVIGDNGEVEEHKYQCATAFFRGSPESRFIWQKKKEELASWVQYLNVDQLMAVLPKLMD